MGKTSVMNILGIDTSSASAAAALMKEGQMAVDTAISHKKTHSVFLMPLIKQIMGSTGTELTDIDYFACGVGPGSFTGVRIGVATMKTFAQVKDKPCVAVDSLYAMCYSERRFEGVVVAMMDARQKRVFSCVTRRGEVIMQSNVLPLDALLETLKEMDENILFVGDGTVAYEQEIQGCGLHFELDQQRIMHGSFIIEAALPKIEAGELETYLSLEPNYVMKSKAEREADANCRADG